MAQIQTAPTQTAWHKSKLPCITLKQKQENQVIHGRSLRERKPPLKNKNTKKKKTFHFMYENKVQIVSFLKVVSIIYFG